MDEASSRFVDRIAVEKLLQEKLSKVHHRPGPLDRGALSGSEEVALADLRSYRAPDRRASVLFAHGLYEDQRDIYRFLFSGLNRSGYAVELYCLPHHYERKSPDSAFSGEYFFSADLPRTRAAFLQAGQELARLYGRLAEATGQPVFLAGFSMGATIALQASMHIAPLAGLCLVNPPAGLADLIWTSPLCRTIRADLERVALDRPAVATFFRDIDPLHMEHGAYDVQRVLMIQATYDLVTSQEQYEALAAAWRFPHRLKYNAGHLNTLRVPRLAEDMVRFFDARMPGVGGKRP